MGKFKVGDRVVTNSNYTGGDGPYSGVVADVDCLNWPIAVDCGHEFTGLFHEDELDLVEAPDSNWDRLKESLKKARAALEKRLLSDGPATDDYNRINGKLMGVTLAISYLEEIERTS